MYSRFRWLVTRQHRSGTEPNAAAAGRRARRGIPSRDSASGDASVPRDRSPGEDAQQTRLLRCGHPASPYTRSFRCSTSAIVRQDLLDSACSSPTPPEQNHLLAGARHHHVEPLPHGVEIGRGHAVPVDVGEHRDIELQALAGLRVDDQNTALVEPDIGSVRCRRRSRWTGAPWSRPAPSTLRSSFQIAFSDPVVRRDDPDQPSRIPIDQPHDSGGRCTATVPMRSSTAEGPDRSRSNGQVGRRAGPITGMEGACASLATGVLLR